MNDHPGYIRNLSNCEKKALKKIQAWTVQAWIIFRFFSGYNHTGRDLNVLFSSSGFSLTVMT